jgi:hypothetical protein
MPCIVLPESGAWQHLAAKHYMTQKLGDPEHYTTQQNGDPGICIF